MKKLLSGWNVCLAAVFDPLPADGNAGHLLPLLSSVQEPVFSQSPTDWSLSSTLILAGQKQSTLVTFLLLREYHRILHDIESAIYILHKRHFRYLGCQFTKFEGWHIWLEWKLATRTLSLKALFLHQWEEYDFPCIVFQDDLLFSLKF